MDEGPTEERTREGIIGEIEAQAIVIADYDPTWAERFHQRRQKSGKPSARRRSRSSTWAPPPCQGWPQSP